MIMRVHADALVSNEVIASYRLARLTDCIVYTGIASDTLARLVISSYTLAGPWGAAIVLLRDVSPLHWLGQAEVANLDVEPEVENHVERFQILEPKSAARTCRVRNY